MPLIDRTAFGRFAPKATPTITDAVVIRADDVLPKWGITTAGRLWMVMAMMDVESAHFTTVFENLNYSAEALRKLWPTHFSEAQAQQYGRTASHPADQRVIANLAYGDRMGNRGSNTDDGWLCRGTGLLGTTGLSGFTKLAKALGTSVDDTRARLTDPQHMLECAVATFSAWGCLPFADRGDVEGCTLLINGGTNGLADRKDGYARAKAIWPTWSASPPMAAAKPPVVTATVTYQQPTAPNPREPAPALPKQTWGDWFRQAFFARKA